jgi:hypothetical protein
MKIKSNLAQEVLGQIRHALLRENNIGLHPDDVFADLLNVLFFQLEITSEVLLFADLNVRLERREKKR